MNKTDLLLFESVDSVVRGCWMTKEGGEETRDDGRSSVVMLFKDSL